MPLSNDNQDFGKSDEINKDNQQKPSTGSETQMTSDDLKGKQQVDADTDSEKDKPAEQSQ